MHDKPEYSVLVDTSFLITLYSVDRPNHAVALRYFKYFLKNSIKLYLSTIVISEFQQMQPIVDLVNSGNYIILPYNYNDAIKTAEIAFNLGGVVRRDASNPKYKDDLKIMGQAEENQVICIITEDKSTLAKYSEKLAKASMFKPKIIIVKDGFDTSLFNNGQSTLIEDD